MAVSMVAALFYWLRTKPSELEGAEDRPAVGQVGSWRAQEKEQGGHAVSVDTTILVIVKSAVEAKPLQNVVVTVGRLNEGAEGLEGREPRRDMTNRRGLARLPLEESGVYRVEVCSSGFVSRAAHIKAARKANGSFRITLTETSEGVAIDEIGGEEALVFCLGYGATLVGRVIDGAATPCAGLKVSAVPLAQIPSRERMREDYNQRDSVLRLRFAEARGGRARDAGRFFASWMELLDGKSADDIERSMRRPVEELLEKIANTLEGYAALSGGRGSGWQCVQVLTTDEKGYFRAEGISPMQGIRLSIFGATTAGLRIIPYEEDLVLDAPGTHQREFYVEIGCVLMCTPVFPNGLRENDGTFRAVCTWDFSARKEQGGEARFRREVILGPGMNEFEVGFFKPTGGVWLRCEGIVGNYWCVGIKETPELQPGLNYVSVELSESGKVYKAGEASVVVVDAAGNPLPSGVCGSAVTVWVKYEGTRTGDVDGRIDADEHSIAKQDVFEKGGKYFADLGGSRDTDEHGVAKIAVAEREGSYTVYVRVGGIVRSESGVTLAPGDEHVFVFPHEAFADTGSVRVKVEDENGEVVEGGRVTAVAVLLEVAGSEEAVCAVREDVATFLCRHLRAGEYTVRVLAVKRIAPRKRVVVSPGVTESVVVTVYAHTSLSGRVLRGDVGVPNSAVFLSGQVGARNEPFDATAESDGNGGFLFEAVPLGVYSCYAAEGKNVYASFRIQVDALQEPVKVDLRQIDIGRRVEFKSIKQRARGSRVRSPVRCVEVRGKMDGLLYWKHPLDLSLHRVGVPGSKLWEEEQQKRESYIAYLPKGEYRVTCGTDAKVVTMTDLTGLVPAMVSEFELTVGDEDQVVHLD